VTEEEAAAGLEVVGGEGVERREGRVRVHDGEEAVARGIDGKAEDGDIFGKVRVGDVGFDNAGVRDGGYDPLSEGPKEEVLHDGIPCEGFRVEIRCSEIDDVGISSDDWDWTWAL